MSLVTRMEEWPSISETISSGTPWARRIDAALWRSAARGPAVEGSFGQPVRRSPEVVGVDGRPEGRAEHEVGAEGPVGPERAGGEPFLELPAAVGREGVSDDAW